MAEMMAQNLMNMSLNQSNKSTKNEASKSPKVLLNKTENPKKAFRKLLEEKVSKSEKTNE